MEYTKHYLEDVGVRVELSVFAPVGGVAECHAMLHVEPRGETFAGQLSRLYSAQDRLAEMAGADGMKVVFQRYFLSDAANQAALMRIMPHCSTSYLQQPPLDGSKVAVWVYLQGGTEVTEENDTVVVRHNGYKHLWKMGMMTTEGDSYQQTMTLLRGYEETLARFGACLADNCVRTWFFTRDVDTRYAGMVKARRENFLEQGLTPETHYIASTGIGGTPSSARVIHQLGAYAITGESYSTAQQQFLYAPTHLNRTIEYGVTFERGTVMHYGDRAHLLISGTASIDNKGRVVHVGDIDKQTERMVENVTELLKEGGADFGNVAQIIVYLRDNADYERVARYFGGRFPDIPTVITLAPVCRPEWLIEMECMAIKREENPQYRDF